MKKRKNSNPGDIIKKNGMYAVVGDFGSLISHGVFVLTAEGQLFPENKPRKFSTKEKRSLR